MKDAFAIALVVCLCALCPAQSAPHKAPDPPMKRLWKGGPRLKRSHVLLLARVLFVTVFAARASAQFETRGTFPLRYDSEPFAVALGDFNHDGKLDAALADFAKNQVAVLLGNGNGTFQAPVYYSVGWGPRSVAIADFNHDANLDLAVTGEGASTGVIGLLFGNGDGTFQPASDLTLSAYPIFVAVADFNGDGIPDMVTSDPPYVSVLLGNGDGTFQPPIDNNSFSPTYPAAIGVGDFNRDGKLDLVVAGQFYTSSEAKVLLGNGDGTFQLGASNSIGDNPNSVAVADFRGIGILDLATTSGFAVQVLLGNGDGTFQPPVNYGTPYFGAGVAVGDFNLDGRLDLAVTNGITGVNGPTNQVSILLGNGDGTFQPAVNYPAGKGGIGLAVGDLNGDHQPDIIVADDDVTSSAHVLLNTGVVSFSPTTPLSFPPQLIGSTSSPRNVTLTNTGTTALSISATPVIGPFQLTSHTTCGTSVPPGGNCTLSVVFTPTAIAFSQGLLSISDSASTKPQAIELSGAGTVITLSPRELDFGSQKVGTKSTPQTVTVTNAGGIAVHVTSVLIGGNYNDYSQTNTCGNQIGPGANCTISVTFAPIRTGARHGTAHISDNGGGGSQGVPLRGTGT